MASIKAKPPRKGERYGKDGDCRRRITGIGRSVAPRLAKDGSAVVANYARNSALAQEVVDEIRHEEDEALAIKADLSDPAEVSQLFDKVLEVGRIEVVVNNASIINLTLYDFKLGDN